MKKRNFIIISTILCSLVTVALVATTIFGSIKKNDVVFNGNESVVDVNVGGNEIVSEYAYLYLIVGDEYADGFITKSNYSGSLLSAQNETTFVANKEGTEIVTVNNGGVIRGYNISIYQKGDGSESNPYNIVRAEDLLKLTSENEGDYKHYIQRCNLDLSSYASWEPIGKLTTPFLGNYNGNGHKITNMNIVVTPENIDKYLDNAQTYGGTNGSMLTIGFFGFVGDINAITTSVIKNVNIENANVNTTAIETETVRPTLKITKSFVGVLAGFVAYTDVIGENSFVTSTINSAVSADSINSVDVGTTGFVGGAYFGNVSGYEIKADITSKNPGVIVSSNGGYKYYGSNYAGILGMGHNTNVEDMIVELSVDVRNYENSIISGAIGYIKSGDPQKAISIKNILVDNLVVNLKRYSYINNYTNIIAGAINCNYNELTTIENVKVNNAIVNSIGSGQVSGVINTNFGTIKNVSVSGLFKGTIVAGVVFENFGVVEFTEDMDEMYPVEVDLRAQTKAAGIAIYNENGAKIVGAPNLTMIYADIAWSPVKTDFDKIKNSSMLAGIAVYNGGEIANLYTNTHLYDGINMAGAVGTLEGLIKNLNINSTMRTIAGTVGTEVYSGQTNYVGGVVAFVPNSATTTIIEDVVANITVNNTENEKIDTSNKFGFNVFGLIVAKVDKNIEIVNTNELNKVEATVYSNYSALGVQKIGSIVGETTNGAVVSAENQKVVLAVVGSAENAEIIK